jgi:CHAD domain-containing protein
MAVVLQFASAQVTGRLEKLSAQVKIARRGCDADAIHDLRVAIRRLLQTLTNLQAWFVRSRVREICRQLTKLLDLAGAVRDCDIASDLLAKWRALDDNFQRALATRRQAAERRLLTTLRQWIIRKRVAQWRTELAAIEPPAQHENLSWDEVARLELPGLAKKFFRSAKRAEATASAGDLHRLRLEAKKLRYSLELFASAYPSTVEDRIRGLHEIQMVLGKISDVRTVRRMARELGGGRKLAQELRRKQRKRIAAFHRYWEAEFSPGRRKEWIHFLRLPARKPVMRSGAADDVSRAVSVK